MRIQSIDALRGIAILGILFMNIYFHGSLTVGYGELTPKPLTDSTIEIFNSLFVDGRFRTLFCILFGVGLAIQYQSCKRKSISPKVFLTARLNWLMIFGLLHGVFIFGGDILLLYSVCALTILSSLTLPLRELLHKSLLFLIIGALLSIIATVVLAVFFEDSAMLRSSEEYAELYELWFSGYLNQIWMQGGVAIAIVLFSPLFIYWQVAGLMMLGIFLYRLGFFTKGLKRSQLVIISLAAIFFTSIDIGIRLSSLKLSEETISTMASISAIFVALLYAHFVIRLINNKNNIIKLFTAPGKLAFSLYILQSITMAIILRFWHQDFHLTAHRIDYVLIAAAYTLIQIALAHWYLRYFNQGPLEYIWRKAYRHSLHMSQKKRIA